MEQLPTDLIVEIFSRLPSKSVARFCTLSKYWASKLRSPYFAELFLSRSLTRPRLLFVVKQNDFCCQIFSTPQPQNPYEKSSHVDFHTKLPRDLCHSRCSYTSGLLYFPYVRISPLICNPITGLYVRLPRYKRFLGFDPIHKQFKVMSGVDHHNILTSKHRGKYYFNKEICINGVLYYLAETSSESLPVIVCVDVRTEKLKFISAECLDDELYNPTAWTLFNYKGKLGGIKWNRAESNGKSELCVWVLEDVDKQKWVNYVYTLPENEILSFYGYSKFSVAGITATGDIVLVMRLVYEPFYVLYFNPEKNTIQSVEIQGFGAHFKTGLYCAPVNAVVDHIEDLSVNNAKQFEYFRWR